MIATMEKVLNKIIEFHCFLLFWLIAIQVNTIEESKQTLEQSTPGLV